MVSFLHALSAVAAILPPLVLLALIDCAQAMDCPADQVITCYKRGSDPISGDQYQPAEVLAKVRSAAALPNKNDCINAGCADKGSTFCSTFRVNAGRRRGVVVDVTALVSNDRKHYYACAARSGPKVCDCDHVAHTGLPEDTVSETEAEDEPRTWLV